MLNPAHTRAAFLNELEKIAITRSVKEYRAASGLDPRTGKPGQQLGLFSKGPFDPAHAANVARASGELGLAPRHVSDISIGGEEAGVDKMIGRVQGPTGESNPSGVLARKLYKPDSAISTQEFTGELLGQKQQFTDAARALSPEAKRMVPAMYGHRETAFPNGQLRHQSFHEFVPGAGDLRGENIGTKEAPIYSRGQRATADLDNVESTVLNPMKAKGMEMADTVSHTPAQAATVPFKKQPAKPLSAPIAAPHLESERGTNFGNVVHSPDGPKILDFLPSVEGKADVTQTSFQKYRPEHSKFNPGVTNIRRPMQELRKEVFNPSMAIAPKAPRPSAVKAVASSAVPGVSQTLNAVERAAAGPVAKGVGSSVPTALLNRFQTATKGLHLPR